MSESTKVGHRLVRYAGGKMWRILRKSADGSYVHDYYVKGKSRAISEARSRNEYDYWDSETDWNVTKIFYQALADDESSE